MHYQNNDDHIPDIVDALRGDNILAFKREVSGYLREGVCPRCEKRELYISVKNPWMIKCGRENNCGHQESTRDLYPDIFESFKNRYPETEANPNATADAYLKINRGFDLSKIKGDYNQSIFHHTKTKTMALVARFPLWDNQYWDRLIEREDVEKAGIKAHFNYGFKSKGLAWKPKAMAITKGDTVYIVEGIFHAIALWLAGYKAVAAFASTMFPWETVKANPDVNWVLAYDDDPAGRKYMRKYLEQLGRKGISAKVALTGETDNGLGKQDWDDLYRAGKLTDRFMAKCQQRGDLFAAKTLKEKAYHWYCQKESTTYILDFDNKLHHLKVSEDLTKDLKKRAAILNGDEEKPEPSEGDSHKQVDLEEAIGETPSPKASKKPAKETSTKDVLHSAEGQALFETHVKVVALSNCFPQFLYCEIDNLTDEITYYFNISFPNENDRAVGFPGSAVDTPSGFRKHLINKAGGATFKGNEWQFEKLQAQWFNHGIVNVHTVPFLGYDKNSGIYVYKDFAFYNGREIKINRHNYFTANKHRIKTSFRSIEIVKNKHFDNSWINDFHKVFHWNGLVALAFWLGSLFAEQIRKELAAFPFLEMSGPPATGKSTVLEFMWKLIGRDEYEGFDPSKATFAARSRAFIQVANMPVVLIEGDREAASAKKGAFDPNELKTAYNGRAVRSMGAFNRGNDIEEPPFRGTVVLAQNAEIDADQAVLERIVHLHFTKAHFSPVTKKLARNFEQANVKTASGFLTAALSNEKDILSHFFDRYEFYEKHYSDLDQCKNQRVIKNHAMVAAMASALRTFLFPQMPEKTFNTLTDFIHSRGITREQRLSADHPAIQQFWEAYEVLGSKTQQLASVDRNKYNHSKDEQLIAIRLQEFTAACAFERIELPNHLELRKLLPTSKQYKFVKAGNVRSNQTDKAVHCWIFERSAPVSG
ncbi:toprim domain-containing protein [Dasania marina]|uniref:toprim domain-containing protein n=1 Tax=Dasania marina TaxID=471499 RepID=UPI000374CD9F|nr:toprim domain-containing protein [Dasania marina]